MVRVNPSSNILKNSHPAPARTASRRASRRASGTAPRHLSIHTYAMPRSHTQIQPHTHTAFLPPFQIQSHTHTAFLPLFRSQSSPMTGRFRPRAAIPPLPSLQLHPSRQKQTNSRNTDVLREIGAVREIHP